jgi:hypothetical protein
MIPSILFWFDKFSIDVPIGLFSASIDARNLPNIPSIFNDFLPRSGGDAGNLSLILRQLTVSNGAVVSAGTTTTGRAGNLSVNAKDFIELSGTSPNDAPPGLLLSEVGFLADCGMKLPVAD